LSLLFCCSGSPCSSVDYCWFISSLLSAFCYLLLGFLELVLTPSVINKLYSCSLSFLLVALGLPVRMASSSCLLIGLLPFVKRFWLSRVPSTLLLVIL
jgi:hypothetical protein